MTRDTLTELLGRVEKATGPDREIDALLWAEFENYDTRFEGDMLVAKSRTAPFEEFRLGWINPGKHQRNYMMEPGHKPPIPDLTSSLDASLALVERAIEDRAIRWAVVDAALESCDDWQLELSEHLARFVCIHLIKCKLSEMEEE